MHGTVQSVRALSFLPGSFEILKDKGLLISDSLHQRIFLWASGRSKLMADLSHDTKYRLGDSVLDFHGGMYVGDVGFDFLNPLVDPLPNGGIIYINAEGKSSVVARNLFYPNGMVITPDNTTLIVAEMLAHRLVAFEINNDGSLKNRRVWARFQNEVKPMGICFDCEGAIWVAGTGPWVLRVREGGDIVHQIATKLPAYAAVLGGPGKRHLFICTSKSNDPVITRLVPSAAIEVAEVEIPGAGVS